MLAYIYLSSRINSGVIHMSKDRQNAVSVSPEKGELQSIIDRVLEAAERLSYWDGESARTGHGSLSFRRNSSEPDELLREIMTGADAYRAKNPKNAPLVEPTESIGSTALTEAKSEVISIADRLGVINIVSDDYMDMEAPDIGRTIRLAESMGAVVHISVEVRHPEIDS